jgi:hypothetical protein
MILGPLLAGPAHGRFQEASGLSQLLSILQYYLQGAGGKNTNLVEQYLTPTLLKAFSGGVHKKSSVQWLRDGI